MTDDELIGRLTALRQQIDELTARLRGCLDQRAHLQPRSAADLQLVGEIDQLETDLVDAQADLRQAQQVQRPMVRDREAALSVDAWLAGGSDGAEHQPLIS